jgi:hypothetical protein
VGAAALKDLLAQGEITPEMSAALTKALNQARSAK